jgi:hypothetical protein
LYTRAGTAIASDDNGGPGSDAFISRFVIPTTTNYFVRVISQSGIGNYTLRVDRTATLGLESDNEYSNDTIAGANALPLTPAGNQRLGTMAGTVMDGQSGNVDEDYFSLGTVTNGETILLSIRLPGLEHASTSG